MKPDSIPLPETLRPLFWDVDFAALDWETDRDPIVRRILGVGGWPALCWLRSTWGDENLRGWLIAHHGGRLSPRQLRYWELVLELPPRLVNEWIAQARSSMHGLLETATINGMEIASCAEDLDLASYGIRPGKCVDDEYLHKVFGIDVTHQKDPAQRPACDCVVSKDIGAYNTCTFGCQYCYATTSFERARAYHAAHDPRAPSL